MKKYTLSVTSPEYWSEIHDALIVDSNKDGIPDRQVTCTDSKNHSPTRGTYELTEEEASQIAAHPHVNWIELSPDDYPDLYPKPEPLAKRFKKNVKVYRDLSGGNSPPTWSGNVTSAEDNRTNWAVVRCGVQTNGDGWPNITGSVGVINTDVEYSLTGKNVDVVIQDGGILQYHPEFMRNGQSRVRDVILDGPLYLDPGSSYLQANTYTKPDGRIGISTTAADNWWGNNSTTYRSARFASGGADDFGTLFVNTFWYTVPNALGDSLDGTNTIDESHGQGCASLACGNNFGMAFEADVWNISIFGNASNGVSTGQTYDFIKVFHKYKPVNPETGIKNPTVVNGSWGYFAGFNSTTEVEYSFKGTTGTFSSFLGFSQTEPQDCAKGLTSGSYTRTFSTSSRSSGTDLSGNEMCEEGVIFVIAAGNDNQRIGVGPNDPHLNDYFTTLNSSESRSGFPQGSGGTCPSGHRRWMHPNGVGYVADPNGFHNGEHYHSICVGCMDEHLGIPGGSSDYAETKASYSNNGPGIDVWGFGDETVVGGVNGVSGAQDYPRSDDTRFYDMFFNGTSAASPVVAGVVALYLQQNPTATSYDVHDWLRNQGTRDTDEEMFYDPYPYSEYIKGNNITDYWTYGYNLRQAPRRMIHSPSANDTTPKMRNVSISGISFKQS
tara:strand:- start:1223 stop:3214 length:1992 start_codon:yes stop_codon:yes gene_type:complete